jgi:hypothetical protein
MSRSYYKENDEQKFPFILPVLRSYKQNLMFDPSLSQSFELPQIDSRWTPSIHSNIKKKKKKLGKKQASASPSRLAKGFKFSPHFNLFRASSKFSNNW